MSSKKETKFAYILAVVCLVLGVFSYAVFSVETPKEPIRIMFKSAAGKIFFDHQAHASESGCSLSCSDCHHHPENDDTTVNGCNECHLPGESETVPESCNDCHEPDEIEDYEMINRVDAFHTQCINCHKEFEAGPEDCAKCHTR